MSDALSSNLEVAPTFTELDYIANEMYQQAARANGYPAGVRWWCLREDKREYWRREARHRFEDWSKREQGLWDWREKL